MDDHPSGAGDGPVDRIPPTGRLTRHPLVRGGPRKARQVDPKGEAENFLDGVRGDLVYTCVYIDPGWGRTLFQEYAESWRFADLDALQLGDRP